MNQRLNMAPHLAVCLAALLAPYSAYPVLADDETLGEEQPAAQESPASKSVELIRRIYSEELNREPKPAEATHCLQNATGRDRDKAALRAWLRRSPEWRRIHVAPLERRRQAGCVAFVLSVTTLIVYLARRKGSAAGAYLRRLAPSTFSYLTGPVTLTPMGV